MFKKLESKVRIRFFRLLDKNTMLKNLKVKKYLNDFNFFEFD